MMRKKRRSCVDKTETTVTSTSELIHFTQTNYTFHNTNNNNNKCEQKAPTWHENNEIQTT